MSARAHVIDTHSDPSPVLLRERDGAVALLTLNRPEARNSLSEALMEALVAALSEIGQDTTIRAVVLAANGAAFSAGHDLKELTARRRDPDRGRTYFQHVMQVCSRLMLTIVRLPQPVIAAVEGVASAAGCQLVASCDLAVASSTARFSTPGVNIGLFCSTPMVALSRNVSRKHALEMLLTGDLIDSDHAYRVGLVNRVVGAGEALTQAKALAHQIAAKSGASVRIGKEAFHRQADMDLAAAYEYTAAVMVENMLARDASEGIGAFIEKRAPRWEQGS